MSWTKLTLIILAAIFLLGLCLQELTPHKQLERRVDKLENNFRVLKSDLRQIRTNLRAVNLVQTTEYDTDKHVEAVEIGLENAVKLRGVDTRLAVIEEILGVK